MGATNSRQPLNQHDLVQLLNWELAAYERCTGTRFTSINAMPRPDDSGCNWSDARLESDHALDLTERGIVRRVIVQTRREFNTSEVAPSPSLRSTG
jgi:hypothetical protein